MSWLDTLEKIRTRDFAKVKPAERDEACRDVVNLCSYAAAMVAVVPLPFSDALLALPIQSAMVLTVAHIQGRKVDAAQAKDLAVELGTLAGASLVMRQGVRLLLPVLGPLLTVPAAFAANWAMGRVAMEYFKNPDVSKAALKKAYDDAVKEGRARFSLAEFERFRKGRGNAEAVQEAVEPKPRKPVRKKSAGKPAAKKPSTKKRAPSAKQLVEEELPARIARRSASAAGVRKVIHLELSGPGGGSWTIDLTRDADWIRAGRHGKPAMTARARATDFVKLGTGQLDPAAALMEGALKLEPMDLELAQAFGKLIA